LVFLLRFFSARASLAFLVAAFFLEMRFGISNYEIGDLIHRRSGQVGCLRKVKTRTRSVAEMRSPYLVGSGVCDRRQPARSSHGNAREMLGFWSANLTFW
jgi:hypothetical protein